MEILAAKKLSDTDLTAALHKAIASERTNIAASIACLIEISARDLHTRLGASSLFVYLTRDLKLSESSASKRCAAVRAIRQFPEMLGLVQSSRLHLSNIALISRHLTRENSVRLIAMAQMETQRGVEKKLALEFPQPAKRDTLRSVVYLSQGTEAPAQAPAQAPGQGHDQEADGPYFVFESGAASSGFGAGAGGGSTFGSGNVEIALGIRMHVTLNPSAAADFEYLVAAMPGKSHSDILSLALNELRKRRELKKSCELGAGKSPSAPPSKGSTGTKAHSDILDVAPVSTATAAVAKDYARSHDDGTTRMSKVSLVSRTSKFPLASRYISVTLRREVARRDGHRCTYVAPVESQPDGVEMTGVGIGCAEMAGAGITSFENSSARRCEAIHQLEFDHVNPRAFGGQNTLGNLRLLCRAHNNLAAKDLMGKEFIESRYRHG